MNFAAHIPKEDSSSGPHGRAITRAILDLTRYEWRIKVVDGASTEARIAVARMEKSGQVCSVRFSSSLEPTHLSSHVDVVSGFPRTMLMIDLRSQVEVVHDMLHMLQQQTSGRRSASRLR